MQDKYKELLMKVISLAAIFSFFYPAAVVAREYLFGTSAGAWGLCFNLAFFYAGYAVARAVIRKKFSFLRKLLVFVSTAVPMAASVFVYYADGIPRILYEMLIIMILYIIGIRGHFLSYPYIISKNTVFMGVFLSTAALITATYYSGARNTSVYVYASCYIFMVLAMIVKNQAQLDVAFTNVDNNIASVPRNIRKYNIIIIFVFIVFISLAFNFKIIVEYAVKVCIWIVLGAIWLYAKLATLFSGGGSDGSEGGGDQSGDLGLPPGGGPNLVVNIVLGVLVGALMLFVVIKIAQAIWRNAPGKFKELVTRIIDFIKRLFTVKTFDPEKSDDYLDEVEKIIPDRTAGEAAGRRMGRNGKRSLKELKKINDPVEKLRYIYGLVLEKLIAQGIDIKKADTASEIARKCTPEAEIDINMQEMTGIYEAARYGGKIPGDADILNAEEDYLSMAAASKNSKRKSV